ncbi:hypothetical protein AVDCRST_MAG94-4034 [uncultured Leptolyngbya sp.]|uniref:peptidylprolyl isomerase n=1 Tax=uncultured Leptolyngbya sp. TaxID=332963 RepID=A0A6J4MUL6_9CYAN|nr:hypothetical protein AVDCRST_MAG94-4034 [uncultured Leptolyngbya sp.]
MTEILQVGNQVIQANEVFSLLRRYQLMPQFLRGLIIDQATAGLTCTPSERQAAIERFYQQHRAPDGNASPEDRSAWLKSQGLTSEQVEELALRPVLLEQFKTATWGSKVEAYFMSRKSRLDRVVYSLIRTKDFGIAQEVYFRIKEGEQSFNELAQQYSQGPEAHTGGVIGPVSLSTPHPAIARILSLSQPGQLWAPTRLEEWFLILRLEKFFPAQLDDSTRHQLINELFEIWLREQIQQIQISQTS